MDKLEQLLAQRDINTRLYIKYGGMPAYYNEDMDWEIQQEIMR